MANSNAEALQITHGSPPDFAILDLQVIDGYSYPTARELRSLNVPFIFATGFGASTLDPEFESAAVVSKPFDFGQLEAVVKGLPGSLPSLN